MVACAARSGQLFNASDIASTVGIDAKTVRGWVSVLEASGIVRLLRPFFSNMEKRRTKSPKLFFMDTGLACYLTAWPDAETLMRGAAAGHMFETFVVSEVLKSCLNAGGDVRDVSFYRARHGSTSRMPDYAAVLEEIGESSIMQVIWVSYVAGSPYAAGLDSRTSSTRSSSSQDLLSLAD